MTGATIPKPIMLEIAKNRLSNIETHKKFCKRIIEHEEFKEWSDFEKQQTIDMLNGVMAGQNIGIIEDQLQMAPGSIKNIFKEQGIDIEKWGKQLYREGDEE